MITITNVGPFNDPNPFGERTYEVALNREVIARFTHTRANGLAKCLQLAAAAVAKAQWENMAAEFGEPKEKGK